MVWPVSGGRNSCLLEGRMAVMEDGEEMYF